MSKLSAVALSCLLLAVPLSGCSEQKTHAQGIPPNVSTKKVEMKTIKSDDSQKENIQPSTQINKDTVQVIAQPDSITVLVNKQNKLPDNYEPSDLVYASIPFLSSQKTEKQEMRKEAADAIKQLFSYAEQQGIHLLGVSAYRSYATQLSLFNNYVNRDGYQQALTYSALPGTSEHETGLAIDVTGGDGQCAAESCFGETKESAWLQENAAKYGFIVRYPKGKESITGYEYEPWHLRYVGTAIAKDIMSRGITLEEYYHAVPVAN